ncbi:hypothetical protein V5O48_010094 [Marasmius crinis-equi]|uniref:Uncharacterized protein n=1 Tax=Marasmius crinis-equi TaxID=585013 RepID=A0ABR3F9F4_9AGAR
MSSDSENSEQSQHNSPALETLTEDELLTQEALRAGQIPLHYIWSSQARRLKQRRQQNSRAEFSKSFATVMRVSLDQEGEDGVKKFLERAWTLWSSVWPVDLAVVGPNDAEEESRRIEKANSRKVKEEKRNLYCDVAGAIRFLALGNEFERSEREMAVSTPLAEIQDHWEVLFERVGTTTTFARWKDIPDDEVERNLAMDVRFSFFNNTS